MSMFLEKITLYDLQGYTIPGFVFLMMVLYGVFSQDILTLINEYENIDVFFVVIILIVSYSVGIALSEFTRILESLTRWLIQKAIPEINNLCKKKNIYVNGADINKAMINSQFWKGPNIPEVNTDAIRMMYSDIQTDKEFNRIHNYASAGVMYKNMFMALFLGDLIMLLEYKFQGILFSGFYGWFYVVLFLSLLFFIRWRRFDKKKNIYTVNWFIKKYIK